MPTISVFDEPYYQGYLFTSLDIHDTYRSLKVSFKVATPTDWTFNKSESTGVLTADEAKAWFRSVTATFGVSPDADVFVSVSYEWLAGPGEWALVTYESVSIYRAPRAEVPVGSEPSLWVSSGMIAVYAAVGAAIASSICLAVLRGR